MKNTEAMEMEDDAETYGLTLVAENPIRNAALFTVMRVVRLFCTLLFEVAALFFATVFGVFGFLTGCWVGALVMLVLGGVLCTIIGDPVSWDNWYLREFALEPGQAFRHPWKIFFLKNPYILAIPAFAAMTVTWGQALAFGIPYRWKNKAPGSMTVLCGLCHKETLDEMRCGKCRGNRVLEHVSLKLIWSVNVFITSLWVAHDCIFGFVGFNR